MSSLLTYFRIGWINAVRQYPCRCIAVHIINIYLLLRQAGKIPTDYFRILCSVVACDAEHMVKRVAFGIGADNGMLNIPEARNGFRAKICIRAIIGV